MVKMKHKGKRVCEMLSLEKHQSIGLGNDLQWVAAWIISFLGLAWEKGVQVA